MTNEADPGVRFVVGRPKGQTTTHVQSVVFLKESGWTADKAIAWLKEHDLRSDKVDDTESSFRFRQRDPGDFEDGSFGTITPGENEAQIEETHDEDPVEAVAEKRVVEETPDYWIIPDSVLTRAGVRNHALRPWDEWEKTARLWEGVPIVYPHPQGDVVTSGDLASVGGFVRNLRLDDAKQRLVVDYWLAKHSTAGFQVSPQAAAHNRETVDRFLRGERIDSSPGYLARREPRPGVLDGQSFDHVKRDIRPDHLAILGVGGNRDVGACSWVHGCGPGRAQEIRAAYESCAKHPRLKSDGGVSGSQVQIMPGECKATEHADLETRFQALVKEKAATDSDHQRHTKAVEALSRELGFQETASCDQVTSRVKENLSRLKALEAEEKTRIEALASECAELEVPGDAKESAVTEKRKELAASLSKWPRAALEHHRRTLSAAQEALAAAKGKRRDGTIVGGVESDDDPQLGVASISKVWPKKKEGDA